MAARQLSRCLVTNIRPTGVFTSINRASNGFPVAVAAAGTQWIYSHTSSSSSWGYYGVV